MNKEKLLPCWLQQCWRMILRTDQVSVRLEQLQHKCFQHWLLSAVSVDEYLYYKLTSKIQQKQWFYNQRGTFCFGILNYVCISIPYILPPRIRQKNPVYESPNLPDKVKFWSSLSFSPSSQKFKKSHFLARFLCQFCKYFISDKKLFCKNQRNSKTSCAG